MYEAVEKAGGMTSEAAQESVNLAQAIEDGQQLRIPSPGRDSEISETGKDVSGLLGAGGAAGNGASQLAKSEAVQLLIKHSFQRRVDDFKRYRRGAGGSDSFLPGAEGRFPDD